MRSALAVTDHDSLADNHLGLQRQRPGDDITCLDANAPYVIYANRSVRGFSNKAS